MAPPDVTEPRRRSGDFRRPHPHPFGPTPGSLGPPDPPALERSLDIAVVSARRSRRPMTLVCLAMPEGAVEPDLVRAAGLVRRTIRVTDGLWRDGPAGLVVLLTDADGPNSEPALARLRLRLRGEGMSSVSMGRASPAPGIEAADLLALARADRQPIGGQAPD